MLIHADPKPYFLPIWATKARDSVPGHISWEGPHALEKVGTVAPLHILHDHAQVFPRLEAAVHGDDEGIVGEGHDVPLSKHLLHLHHHQSQ